MAELTDHDLVVRQDLLDRIEQSARGKYVLMIKTLMAYFGFNAGQRVRQSSLSEVTRKLTEWGIGHDYVGEVTSLDYIRLFKLVPETAARRMPTSAPPAGTAGRLNVLPTSPFEFIFDVGDGLEQSRSEALTHDIFACIWSSRPVMLFIDAPDEFFALAGGMVGAAMRRRQTMARSFATGGSEPCGPEVVSHDRLKALMGQAEGAHDSSAFPQRGAVYLYRDDAEQTEDEELAAFVRELFIPQTFRVRSRFDSSAGDDGADATAAVNSPHFPSVLAWIALFAGAPHLAATISTDRLFDLSSLFAEACQLRESLMDRSTLESTDRQFRSGFESTEHMVLKNLVLRDLRQRFPNAEVHVERSMLANEPRADREDEGTDVESEDRLVQGRPDIRVPGRVSVEVETLRALVLPGSNPFFALEQKLRRKLAVYRDDKELWLVVPGDLALLANRQLQAVARNLAAGSESPRIQIGLVDLGVGRIVLVDSTPPPKAEIRLVGASWRGQRQSQPEQLSWESVAGYSDVKSRLHADLLAPLRDPARYARHKLGSSNGLLLYGLPGCGKSLIGRVLAGVAQLPCRRLVPSDLNGMYVGESTMKTRDQFDWALKQGPCLLIIDELDAIAPQRSEQNMHSDEKRQVNELLAQLDRIQGKPIVVVATTNYYRGIDSAVRRSGRFDIKLPIFPPAVGDRALIFRHYLIDRLSGFHGTDQLDFQRVAQAAVLFAPADIRVVVETEARRAIARASDSESPRIDEAALLTGVRQHTRSIQLQDALDWIQEAESDLGSQDAHLHWLREEVSRAYPN